MLTAMAPLRPCAVRVVPSSGSTAMSTLGGLPSPICSPAPAAATAGKQQHQMGRQWISVTSEFTLLLRHRATRSRSICNTTAALYTCSRTSKTQSIRCALPMCCPRYASAQADMLAASTGTKQYNLQNNLHLNLPYNWTTPRHCMLTASQRSMRWQAAGVSAR